MKNPSTPPTFRNRIPLTKLFWNIFRNVSFTQKAFALAAPLMGLFAAASWVKIALGIENHPVTRVHIYHGRPKQAAAVKKLRVFPRKTVKKPRSQGELV